MAGKCLKCWCDIDRDDWDADNGVCGSCIREMKSYREDEYEGN